MNAKERPFISLVLCLVFLFTPVCAQAAAPTITVTLSSPSVVGGGVVSGTLQVANWPKKLDLTLSSTNQSANPVRTLVTVDGPGVYGFAVQTSLTDRIQTGEIKAETHYGPKNTLLVGSAALTVTPNKLAVTLSSTPVTGGGVVVGTVQAPNYT